MNDRLKPTFAKSGVMFHAEHITSVRNWSHTLEKYSTLAGAYRKRKMLDEKEVPHSFTFCRRDCIWTEMNDAVHPFVFFWGVKSGLGLNHIGIHRPFCHGIIWAKIRHARTFAGWCSKPDSTTLWRFFTKWCVLAYKSLREWLWVVPAPNGSVAWTMRRPVHADSAKNRQKRMSQILGPTLFTQQSVL